MNGEQSERPTDGQVALYTTPSCFPICLECQIVTREGLTDDTVGWIDERKYGQMDRSLYSGYKTPVASPDARNAKSRHGTS